MASAASLGILLFLCLVAFPHAECRSAAKDNDEQTTRVQSHDLATLLRRAVYRPFHGDGFDHGRWRHHGLHYRRHLRRSRHRLRKNIRRLLREWRRFQTQGGLPYFAHFMQRLRHNRRLRYTRFSAAPGFLLWWLRLGRHRFGSRWPEGAQTYIDFEHPESDVLLTQENWPGQKLLYAIRNYPGFLQLWKRRYPEIGLDTGITEALKLGL
ncbi:hypothetical protein V5799_021823 [Amblyomma americanum]|uniref:Secreted protein n=1 Tax=Amblyomma americanum TaxID=6943 RepID=A0AAQ4FNR3_AMBAM